MRKQIYLSSNYSLLTISTFCVGPHLVKIKLRLLQLRSESRHHLSHLVVLVAKRMVLLQLGDQIRIELLPQSCVFALRVPRVALVLALVVAASTTTTLLCNTLGRVVALFIENSSQLSLVPLFLHLLFVHRYKVGIRHHLLNEALVNLVASIHRLVHSASTGGSHEFAVRNSPSVDSLSGPIRRNGLVLLGS